jgi:hypothetical protein
LVAANHAREIANSFGVAAFRNLLFVSQGH